MRRCMKTASYVISSQVSFKAAKTVMRVHCRRHSISQRQRLNQKMWDGQQNITGGLKS